MSLQTYIEKEQTALFNKLGVFFAFSDKQFAEKKQDGVKYVSLGAGCLCPKDNVKTFVAEHEALRQKAIATDIKENGKTAIIKRELANYECYYTGDISEAVDALEGYGFTEEEIYQVFCKG